MTAFWKVHTGFYWPNLFSFRTCFSGDVDYLLFSVSGLLFHDVGRNYFLSLSYDAYFQDLTERRNKWVPVTLGCKQLFWLHLSETSKFKWILTFRLSCKKSIKRKPSIEESSSIFAFRHLSPFVWLFRLCFHNPCLEYYWNEVWCTCLHFLYFPRK